MKRFLSGLAIAAMSLTGSASATSIVNYSEDAILEALARVALSTVYCTNTSRPMFNAMDIVWDVVELKAGVDPNEPIVSDRYFKFMEQQDAAALKDKDNFCAGIVKDFGPQGQVIADLVIVRG